LEPFKIGSSRALPDFGPGLAVLNAKGG
jgi:hypothetical protein